MLVFLLVSWNLTKPRESEGVEFGGIFVEFWVLVDGMAVDCHAGSCRDNVTGRCFEALWVRYDAGNVDCSGLVLAASVNKRRCPSLILTQKTTYQVMEG